MRYTTPKGEQNMDGIPEDELLCHVCTHIVTCVCKAHANGINSSCKTSSYVANKAGWASVVVNIRRECMGVFIHVTVARNVTCTPNFVRDANTGYSGMLCTTGQLIYGEHCRWRWH